MIKFFRRIRKKLLSDLPAGKAGNRLSKYLVYAGGEIILGMIGILLALQVNNWNENRQQRGTEQAYLVSLQSEFKSNLEKINNCLTNNKKQIKSVKRMLTLFDNNVRDTTSKEEVAGILFSVLRGVAKYTPSKSVVTDLLSSGNLNLIENENLRQKIAAMEGTLELLDIQEKENRQLLNEIQSLLKENGSVRKVMIQAGIKVDHHPFQITQAIRMFLNQLNLKIIDKIRTIQESAIRYTNDQMFPILTPAYSVRNMDSKFSLSMKDIGLSKFNSDSRKILAMFSFENVFNNNIESNM